MADIDGMTERVAATNRDRTGPELLEWLAEARAGLIEAARAAEPGLRTPWYGPPMSVASQITARIMETWAHGQDVADALGLVRPSTDRLRHVVFLGVRTLPNSFLSHHLRPDRAGPGRTGGPGRGPLGVRPGRRPDRIPGPAVDFALAVTQRRHLDDLALVVTGRWPPSGCRWLRRSPARRGRTPTRAIPWGPVPPGRPADPEGARR